VKGNITLPFIFDAQTASKPAAPSGGLSTDFPSKQFISTNEVPALLFKLDFGTISIRWNCQAYHTSR
jgi:hypothetical protein